MTSRNSDTVDSLATSSRQTSDDSLATENSSDDPKDNYLCHFWNWVKNLNPLKRPDVVQSSQDLTYFNIPNETSTVTITRAVWSSDSEDRFVKNFVIPQNNTSTTNTPTKSPKSVSSRFSQASTVSVGSSVKPSESVSQVKHDVEILELNIPCVKVDSSNYRRYTRKIRRKQKEGKK